MAERERVWSVIEGSTAAGDLASAELGHVRRTRRYVRIVEALSRHTAASIPTVFASDADSEGYYRFMRHSDHDYQTLLEPHLSASAACATALETTRVLHDTTHLHFPLHDGELREHLARRAKHTQGFLWHVSLAVSDDAVQVPLGLVAARPYVHDSELDGDAASRAYWKELGCLYDNEKWRWMDGVQDAEERLEACSRVIHVMDREGDDYQLLFALETAGYGWVVRVSHDRNVKTGPNHSEYERLSAQLARVDWQPETRDVVLSTRSERQASKRHAARRAQTVTCQVRACSVTLRRPDELPADSAWPTVETGVVEVRGGEGDDEVHWLLVTDQPIETPEQMWQVVDWYRARWRIEEYFKALKSGCGYEKLQHRSADTLLNALATMAPVAWQLLLMRHLAREAPEMEASAVVARDELRVLRALQPKLVPESATVADVLLAVAKLGGHRTSNGPPGWQILARGWRKLSEVLEGFRLAMQLQAEAAEM